MMTQKLLGRSVGQEHERSDWASYAPHPQYGNIYYPYHINEHSWRRYTVCVSEGKSVTRPICWSEAVFAAQQLNAGETSPALESMKLEDE
jgi:hypothetical protein